MKTVDYVFPKIQNIDPSCYIDAYNLVLECSSAHTPRGFVVRFLELMKRVCPYDEAFVMFMDAHGKLAGLYTVNIDSHWPKVFEDYYLKRPDFPAEFSPFTNVKEDSSGYRSNGIIDWSTCAESEFLTNYIKARHLCYSWGFSFYDLNGNIRVIMCLDRTRPVLYSEAECNRLLLALPILNNMHRNFYYQGRDNSVRVPQSSWSEYRLTKRETEIADLLCQGMSVQNISSALFIAVTTTYKHIANIYEKVGVSSQQELLVKLLKQ